MTAPRSLSASRQAAVSPAAPSPRATALALAIIVTAASSLALSPLVTALAPSLALGAQQVVAARDTATAARRPFGTLRDQAERQQRWLAQRLDSVLPALMREHGVDMWVVPMREYNEDPVFVALVSPTTFAARRRTIYVFHDRGAGRGVERLALGGTSQGGLYETRAAARPADGPAGGAANRRAELWGEEQWKLLRDVVSERAPRRIAIDVSRTHAFSDGLTAGEHDALRASLGPETAARLVPAERLPLDMLTVRLPDEAAAFRDLNREAWSIIETAFSRDVVTPGVTTTDDVVWWMRQRLADLGLGTWFQPSVSVQRQGWTDQRLGESPVIQRGDVLWCDFGLTALRLNTDTQHMGYVLRDGESEPPPGLVAALGRANRLQDIVLAELRPGRTGNEVLAASRARMTAEGIDGTIYSHPIGLHGHGAGPLIGLWDYQSGVPGRGDVPVLRDGWFSIELQATSPVPEWGGQPVRAAQEEDVVLGPDGVPRWAFGRQTRFHLVR
ncbi:MAG: M24 family metallopeptidase [Gemmatimonadaceae bacterium]